MQSTLFCCVSVDELPKENWAVDRSEKVKRSTIRSTKERFSIPSLAVEGALRPAHSPFSGYFSLMPDKFNIAIAIPAVYRAIAAKVAYGFSDMPVLGIAEPKIQRDRPLRMNETQDGISS